MNSCSLCSEEAEKPEGNAPSFAEKPKIIPEDGGKLIVMEVRILSDSSPTITWYHGNDEVQLSSRVTSSLKLQDDVYIARLEIRVSDAPYYYSTITITIILFYLNILISVFVALIRNNFKPIS